ncbi:ABC transporter permease [Streptomyces sp. MUSC 125]|uniref:ABC transporter permease n=1 Tax=Streptomyces sp. MUSC 125 TaxID=1428624 RepID=UPI000AB85A9F|nr:ABC transporter permease [Streptomyces sp. MUSC 125]
MRATDMTTNATKANTQETNATKVGRRGLHGVPGLAPGGSALGPTARRLRALARAELTLLIRNRGAVVTALVVPLVLPLSVRPALDQLDLKKQGLSMGTVLLTTAIGFSFLFAVYTSLVSAYVARREELVLKRLRTGELSDTEILTGTALPATAVGLAQAVVLSVGCAALLHIGAPKAPQLLVPGVLAGLVVSAALAALTASVTRTTESAQVTALPLVLVSMVGSGVAIPAEVLPGRLASVCAFLPLSPAIRLVRAGWSGQLSAHEAFGALATALAWTIAAVFAVRRWFRWEPRR